MSKEVILMWLRDLLAPEKLILILIILVFVMGPNKLAGIGGGLGKSIHDFRQSLKSEDEEVTTKREA